MSSPSARFRPPDPDVIVRSEFESGEPCFEIGHLQRTGPLQTPLVAVATQTPTGQRAKVWAIASRIWSTVGGSHSKSSPNDEANSATLASSSDASIVFESGAPVVCHSIEPTRAGRSRTAHAALSIHPRHPNVPTASGCTAGRCLAEGEVGEVDSLAALHC